MGRQSRIQLLLRKGRRYSDAAILVFTAILAAEPDRFDQAAPFIASATRIGQDWAWVVILVSLVARWVCDWGLGVLGKRVLMPVVKEVLDRFRDGVFPEKKGDHAHHRVTLFLHRGLLLRGFDRKHGGWPWSGWLVPIARSGHTAQKTKVRFLAEGGTDRYQGIAGKAWATRRDMAPATSLPDLHHQDVTEADFAKYAEDTHVSLDSVKKRLPRARSLMGFVLARYHGSPWGVLVVDSRNPDLDQERAKREFRNHGEVLGRLLEAM